MSGDSSSPNSKYPTETVINHIKHYIEHHFRVLQLAITFFLHPSKTLVGRQYNIYLYLQYRNLNSSWLRMSFIKRNKTIDNPISSPEKKLIQRKALPLPVLSLQTKTQSHPKTYEIKKAKTIKPLVRQNFKKALDILSKSQQKNQSIPTTFHNNTAQTKDIVRKRMKTNLEFYQSKVEHLLIRTEIMNTLKRIEVGYRSKVEGGDELQCSKLSMQNLHRTIKFRKRQKKPIKINPNGFLKWQSFCASISYHSKSANNITTIQCKKKLPQRIFKKKRSQSNLCNIDKGQGINGWEDKLVRYVTDVNQIDFSDIYQ